MATQTICIDIPLFAFTLLLLTVYYLCIVTLPLSTAHLQMTLITLTNLYPHTLTRYIALLLLLYCVTFFTLVYLVNIF
jgi:hypothetical protein